MAFCKSYFLLFLLFCSYISTCFSLDESDIDQIENKIKTNKYCKNYLNAVCCAEDAETFTSGTSSPLYTPGTVVYSTDDKKFSKVAIFQGLDIENLRGFTTWIHDKDIQTLKIIGSPRVSVIGQSTFSRYSNLHTLDLSYNSITFQHQSEIHAFVHTKLTELNLSHNKIGSTDFLMKALGYLPNLRSLYLNHNRNLQFGLNGFPASLEGLEFLDLSYCHIWNLDDNVFANLRNLKSLHLEGNALSIIPKSLCIRQPTLQLYLAKTHIDKSHQRHLQQNCSVTTSFEMPMPVEKSFKIVDNDRWNLSVWFYLFILAGFLNFGLILYLFYTKLHPERMGIMGTAFALSEMSGRTL